ncbi:MAG: putative quinol monooxygenase [Pseudomonadota bacterium]
MIVVWGSVETSHENRDALLEVCLQHVRRSRMEPGCIEHGAYVDSENDDRIAFFERWESADALKAHFAVPESAAFVAQLRAMATAEPVMSIYTASEGM